MVTVDNLTTTYNGLSTDQKPNFVHNGDKYRELDTGKTYIYNETGSEWVEMPTSSGGSSGGSSSGGGVVFVEEVITNEETYEYTLQASYNYVVGCIEEGKLVVVTYTFSYEDEQGEIHESTTTTRYRYIIETSTSEMENTSTGEKEIWYSVITDDENFYATDPDEYMTNNSSGGGGDDGR